MNIIQTCQTSGMSDKDWCTEHRITPSKFYYHIRRLRANAYEIPDIPKSPVHHPKQEVIPFSVDGTCLQENRSPVVQERIVPDIPQAAGIIQDEPAIRLTIGHCCADIFNKMQPVIRSLTLLLFGKNCVRFPVLRVKDISGDRIIRMIFLSASFTGTHQITPASRPRRSFPVAEKPPIIDNFQEMPIFKLDMEIPMYRTLICDIFPENKQKQVCFWKNILKSLESATAVNVYPKQ